MDGRAAATAGLVVVLAYLLLTAVLALAPPPSGERVGPGAVAVATSVVAVLTWALAGWLGSRPLRAQGVRRSTTVPSVALGATAGYLAVPALVGVVGLLLVGAPAGALLAGPLLSAVLAGLVAGLGALLARHAPPPAPYTG